MTENIEWTSLSLTHTSNQGDFTLTIMYLFCLVCVTLSRGAEGLEVLTNLIQAWPGLVLMDNQHSISGWHFPAADQLLCPCAGVMFRPVIIPWPLAWDGDKQHKKQTPESPAQLQVLEMKSTLKWYLISRSYIGGCFEAEVLTQRNKSYS